MSKLMEGLATHFSPARGRGENEACEYKIKYLTELDDAMLCLWNSCMQPKALPTFFKHRSLEAKQCRKLGRKKPSKDEVIKRSKNRGKPGGTTRHIRRNMNSCLRNVLKCVKSNDVKEEDKMKIMEMLCLMVFQVRDCRKDGVGKGARYPAYRLFVQLYKDIPKTLDNLVELFGQFGYWKDLKELRMFLTGNPHEWGSALGKRISVVFGEQLAKDIKLFTQFDEGGRKGKVPVMTLAAKWAPRRNKLCDRTCDGFIGEIAAVMYPNIAPEMAQKKQYRQDVAKLNRYLDTTEIKMCEKRFRDIKFDKIPGRCLNRNKAAFQGTEQNKDEDRQACRENFLKFTAELKNKTKSAKGLSMMPHELVKQIFNTSDSDETKEIIEAQWRDHEKHLSEYCEKLLKETGSRGLSNAVILSDVSGSMNGDPMNFSIAMAILISKIQTGPFYGRFMTFHADPKLVDISRETSLKGAATAVKNSPWGGNTDILKAFSIILDTAQAKKLEPEDMPTTFIIISDMQFDQCTTGNSSVSGGWFEGGRVDSLWKNHHSILKDGFRDAGLKICGKPYELPLMIYWNARGDVSGVPVTSSEEGALMISGFSSNLVKLLLTQFDKFVKPYELLVSALNHEFYSPVRRAIAKVREAPYFSNYVFEDVKSTASAVKDDKKKPQQSSGTPVDDEYEIL